MMEFWLPKSEKVAHERMKALSDFIAGLIRIAVLGALTDATTSRLLGNLLAPQTSYSFQAVYELFGLLLLTLVFGGLLVCLTFHLIVNAQMHVSAWTKRYLLPHGAPRWLRGVIFYSALVVIAPPLLLFVFSGGAFISEFLGWDPVEQPLTTNP